METFEELVEMHYEALYRFGYSLCKSPDIASDLVQQAFCIWAEKGHQLKDKSKAKTWLFTTLYREYLRLSKKGKKFIGDDISELEYSLPAPAVDNERLLDGKYAVYLLGTLDEIFKAPLVLFFLQQHSYKEIAEILDIPIGTVMSRISRGKELLKTAFHSKKEGSHNKVIQIKKIGGNNG